MAWCANPHCRKQGLSKDDVEFCEDTKLVLCTGCYALRHPGWVPPVVIVDRIPELVPQLNYEVHLTSREGFSARVSYGQLSLGFHAPISEIKRYLGAEAAEAILQS